MFKPKSLKSSVLCLVILTLMSWSLADSHDHDHAGGEGDAAVVQLETAIAHANNSLNADAVGGATTHLAHVMNCLEGEGGENFDADWGNPCSGQGAGIVNDIMGHEAGAQVALLVAAANDLTVAAVHEGSEDLTTIHNAAEGARALLEIAIGTLQE